MTKQPNGSSPAAFVSSTGIVVRRGNELRFWHLTFQEYLAARAIGGRNESEQQGLLLGEAARLYSAEWREVVLLLGGVLYEQGRNKVEGLVKAVLDDLGQGDDLGSQARAAGMLGALVRDLRPFDYVPTDPRYLRLMDSVLAVFDPEKAKIIPVDVRVLAAEALGGAGDPRLEDESSRWVPLRGGRFTMGSQSDRPGDSHYDEDAEENEIPPHKVELTKFRIGRWPVTVKEYADFMDDEGYRKEEWWPGGGFGDFEQPEDWEAQLEHGNRPVVGVSWFEAAAYCAWLTVRRRVTGLSRDSEELARLPTEAEWEYAARGSEGRRYPWGRETPQRDLLNFELNVGSPTPVGIYPAGHTPEGVADMAGSVWEWCGDWFGGDYYDACLKSGIVENPTGPADGAGHVLRGGSWFYVARYARAAFRFVDLPELRLDRVGFRVLLSELRQDSLTP